jgi:uncharacterized membrane protein
MSAEDIIRKHCNIEYTKYSGEEVVHSSLYAVCIALEEYADQQASEKLLRNFFIWLNEYENLEYTEKGIEFYVKEFISKK